MHITNFVRAKTKGSSTDLCPTRETYDALETLFDAANAALFGGRLARPLFNCHRQNNSMGYLSLGKVENEVNDKADKLTLNPDYLRDASTLDVLVVIVHLMTHMDQAYFGNPSRNGYHNREFANMAKKIGLHPSDTGEPDGKETGQRISHFVVEGGPFHALATEMEARGVGLRWREIEKKKSGGPMIDGDESQDGEAKSKRCKKFRVVCPYPHPEEDADILEAWGRESLEISCTIHGVPMIPG